MLNDQQQTLLNLFPHLKHPAHLPLRSFNLSHRTYKALIKAFGPEALNISLLHLSSCSKSTLLLFKGVGPAVITELETLLNIVGLNWK